jgi:transposase
MSGTRQRYNEEFKQQTVKYIQEQTKTVAELALELDVPAKTLHQWLGKYRQFNSEPIVNMERVRELERLLQEKDQRIADVEEELAIVKKAVHIFSKPRN